MAKSVNHWRSLSGKQIPTMPRNMKPATLRLCQERLLRALSYIQERLDGPLPLDELARQAGFAPHHLCSSTHTQEH